MNPDPRLLQRLWLIVLVACIGTWLVASITGWISSVKFVSHMSMLALVLTAGAGVVGESIRRRQREEDVPREVVEGIVEHTEIAPADEPRQ